MQCAQRVEPAQRWVPSAQSRVITGPQEPARKKSGWLGRPGRPRRATGLLHFARVIRRFPFGFSVESISLSQILVPRCQALRKKTSGHFPRWFILPTGRSLLWKCFPAPTSNKYWKRFLSSATDQKTMEDKGADGRRRHRPEGQKAD